MKKVVPLDPVNPDPYILTLAASVLQNGGIIALPTDTFYGLAVNPHHNDAVKRLFEIKKRHPSKPIILLIDHISKLDHLIEKMDSPLLEAMIREFWPGPLTLIFKKSSLLVDRITGGTQTIGIRLPNAAIPIGIIQRTGFPITASSANRSGEPPATTAKEIEEKLGAGLDLILDGGACEGLPSTLLDLTGSIPQILREGEIPSFVIEAFLKKKTRTEPFP